MKMLFPVEKSKQNKKMQSVFDYLNISMKLLSFVCFMIFHDSQS